LIEIARACAKDRAVLNTVATATSKASTVICARPHHALFRGLGAALALLTFASPLLGSFHEAAVPHIACPEDGELIDVPVERAHSHAAVPEEGPSLFAERDPAGPTPAGGQHDHCQIALQAHVSARQPGKVRAVKSAVLVAAAPLPVEPPRLRNLALYRIAPKASPPA
jgi:hypothetical protein